MFLTKSKKLMETERSRIILKILARRWTCTLINWMTSRPYLSTLEAVMVQVMKNIDVDMDAKKWIRENTSESTGTDEGSMKAQAGWKTLPNKLARGTRREKWVRANHGAIPRHHGV